MPSLTNSSLINILQNHSTPRYWIAYSGGLDSHVLLDLCASIRQQTGWVFQAVHVHHGLLPLAEAWTAHCEAVCRDLDLPCLILRVDARPKPGESPEEAARLARYGALREQLQPGEIILTAQHRDDQAETLLLQLLRGAGLAGLAAMGEISPLEPGWLLRPLLGFSRQELRDYALGRGLNWIEDPSNQDSAYDRNFLRNQVIPLLSQRWPGLNKALARTAAHCAEAQQQLNDLAADLCATAFNDDGHTLSIAKLKTFKPADQRLVLREWIRIRGFRRPSLAVIERILQEVLPARIDKTPLVSWREGEVRRYRDGLYLLPPSQPLDSSQVLAWDGQASLDLPQGNGRLTASIRLAPGIALDCWQSKAIEIRYRQGGELCRLAGRAGTHELKKLFQEKGIPPWLRDRAPLIYLDGELAAVAGWWVCESFAGKAGAENVILRWDF